MTNSEEDMIVVPKGMADEISVWQQRQKNAEMIREFRNCIITTVVVGCAATVVSGAFIPKIMTADVCAGAISASTGVAIASAMFANDLIAKARRT